jgi:hypothetical protein
MARDAISIVTHPVNTGTDPGAGTTINPANGGVIAAGGKTTRLLIRVENTNAAGKNVTVKAGIQPPAWRASLGDLVVQVPATTGVRDLVIESARFGQTNGDIYLDFETGMTGKAYAITIGDDV